MFVSNIPKLLTDKVFFRCNSRNHITKAKVCSHIDFLGKFGIWVTSVGGIFFVTIAYINSNIFKGVIITIAMDCMP